MWVLVGLIVLVVAAAAIFALTFDPNRYKDDLERLTKERTGRTLDLKGDLKVAFYPSLGADVAGVTLSERGSDQTFVSLDSAHASVKLLPLLRGQVIVDGVRVSGLTARVVKDKDGRYNFSDLMAANERQAAGGSGKAKAEEKSGPVQFDIAGIDIEGAKILYRDLASGEETTLSDLKLQTGRIAESAQGKLDFSVNARRNQPPLDSRLALSGNYSIKPDAFGLDFNAKLDESTIEGKLNVARAATPSYAFDLNIDRLNLDKYLASSQAKPAGGAAGGQGKAAGPASPEDAPVDLSALKNLNASGQLQIGALQVHGLKLSSLKTQLKAANGRAQLAPHSATLYEGRLAGEAVLDANGNRIALKENLSDVAVGPLLRDVAEQDRLEGRGSFALDVTGAGATVNAIKRSLAGNAKLDLHDGAIKGINVGELLRKARAALGSQSGQADNSQRTDFTQLTASFTIKNGVAHNEDLDIKAPLFRIGGAGDIDLAKSTLNYVAKASVVATTKGQGGKELEQLAGLTVPVRLSGSFSDLKYQVDYKAAASDLAKSKAGEKAKEAVEKNKGKIEQKLGEQLKGLLGR